MSATEQTTNQPQVEGQVVDAAPAAGTTEQQGEAQAQVQGQEAPADQAAAGNA